MNLTIKRLRVASVAFVAVAVFVAGCGGSGPSTTPTKSTASTSTPTSTTASTSQSTTASTGASTTATTGTNESIADCSQLDGVGKQFEAAIEHATTGGNYNLTAAAADFQKIVGVTPSAIRGDMQTIATAFTSFASKLTAAGFKPGKSPTPTELAAVEAAAKSFQSSQVQSAEKAIQAWSAQNCKS